MFVPVDRLTEVVDRLHEEIPGHQYGFNTDQGRAWVVAPTDIDLQAVVDRISPADTGGSFWLGEHAFDTMGTMKTSPVAINDEVPLEHLEHEICQLSAHLAAAMCRWSELVAEFDRREGWGERDVPTDRADALVAMAETMLHHGPAARDGGDKYQVVVLVGADVLAGVGDHSGEGRCQVEDGPRLAADTALRLACDAAVVAASLKSGGEPLNVGRSTQSIPRGIRRALRLRDGGCRFPSCTQTRFVDGHHILHWAHGGETSLANLVLLCRFHHRAIHERGFEVVRRDDGRLVFTTASGAVIPEVPTPEPEVDLDVEAMNRHLGVVLSSDTGATLWGGERLDLGLAIDALMCLEGRNLPDDDATGRSVDPD